MQNKIDKLIIFIIFLLPFAAYGGLYTQIKIYLFYLVVVVCVFRWLFVKNFNFRIFNKLDVLYFLWLIILFIASLLGVHPLESILGGSLRGQGVIFFLGLWVISISVRSFNKQSTRNLVSSIILAGIIESIVVVLQYFSGVVVEDRAVGTFGEPNNLSLFLGIPLILSVFAKIKYKYATILLIGVALLLTKSISGAVVFPLTAIYLLINKLQARKEVKYALAILGTLVVLSGMLFLVLNTKVTSLNDRLIYWQFGIKAISLRPIIGYGAESGASVYNHIYSKWGPSQLNDFVVDRSHNILIDLMMWSGIFGLVFFGLWLLGGIKQTLTKVFSERFIAVTYLFIFSLFQPLGVVSWVLLFVLLNLNIKKP